MLAAAALVAVGTAVFETRQQQAPSSARASIYPTLQASKTCMRKQNQLVDEINSGNAPNSSKPIKQYSSPYSDDYAGTHSKDNQIATKLPSFLSKNQELGKIVKMLDGIEQNGHAHWAERSIAMVVDHLVEHERYDDAKTFIDSITFKDGDYDDTHLKDNLINMLPEYLKLELHPEQKHTTVPGTTPLPN